MDVIYQECPEMQVFELLEDMATSRIEWQQWGIQDGKTAKVTCTGTMATCMEELKSPMPKFLQHTFTKRVQA